MKQAIIAFVLLAGSVWSANAGPMIGAEPLGAAAPVIKVACEGDDRMCSAGLYYGCSRSRGCQCYICGTATPFNDYYYGQQRRYSPPPPPQYYSRPRYYDRY